MIKHYGNNLATVIMTNTQSDAKWHTEVYLDFSLKTSNLKFDCLNWFAFPSSEKWMLISLQLAMNCDFFIQRSIQVCEK